MKLTGKCKEDFEKWYLQWVFNEKTFLSLRFNSEQILENWNSLHQSEKYGVYVDFFNTKKYEGVELFDKCFSLYFYHKTIFETHNDIVKQAIEKANEIYNKTFKTI
jgi:hypothetical protein